MYPFPPGHPSDRRSRHTGRTLPSAVAAAVDLNRTIGPGDCVFVGARWWHAVESLDAATISVVMHMEDVSTQEMEGV